MARSGRSGRDRWALVGDDDVPRFLVMMRDRGPRFGVGSRIFATGEAKMDPQRSDAGDLAPVLAALKNPLRFFGLCVVLAAGVLGYRPLR